MNRLTLTAQSRADAVLEDLYKEFDLRVAANPQGLCPIDAVLSFVRLCQAQSCGKCVPCRVGLGQLCDLMEQVLDSKATMQTVKLIEKTAQSVYETADCAIGYAAAELVIKAVKGFKDDFVSHITNGVCNSSFLNPVPCKSNCPAHVDIPGYIALVGEGRYADAVKLIRKDNPFPSVCARICEHPCEEKCRRGLVDAAVNIRALKHVATDRAGVVPAPKCAEKTGKKVAIIGGGPAGLTAAYFLNLMGHETEIYEQRAKLGGMLRYGIPVYRLPDAELDSDIDAILSTGTSVHLNYSVGKDGTFDEIRANHDATFIAIGAHSDNKLGIEGEEAQGVTSAVALLRAIGDGERPDFKGKNVVVVGGGNVAMDCTRSSVRLGAAKVTCVYRRRQEDMTALAEEVEGAKAEGCVIATLMSPVRVKSAEGKVVSLVVQPQIIGEYDAKGRPAPRNADVPEQEIPADIIVVAIGQSIEAEQFGKAGMELFKGSIVTDAGCAIKGFEDVFAGGDCATGPATAIKAIAAGKTAAANIDSYLGYEHKISCDVELPTPKLVNQPRCARINEKEREAGARCKDFDVFEYAFSDQEAKQECSRCLKCDYFGYGKLEGGRELEW